MKKRRHASSDYDVIILDPPPALGMVSLSVLYAANALIIPMPTSTVDFASMAAFFCMLTETMAVLEDKGMLPDYGFVNVLLSKVDSSSGHGEMAELVRSVFGNVVLSTEIKSSAEFHNASARLQSVYDLARTPTNHGVRQRCLTQLNNSCSEIERSIRTLWPSSADDE
jgi:chromosome partitioning protein